MDRQAKEENYHRFLTAFTQRFASLPTGSLMSMLDLLSRAQFLEGLAGVQFNTVSARGSSSKDGLRRTIAMLLQKIDPTVNPSTSVWTADGSSGLYKSAWLGANRVLASTQSSATGNPLEATDLLSANLLQKLEALPKSDGSPEGNANAIALEESMEGGNFFYEAGRRFRPKKVEVAQGLIDMDKVGSAVALYAKNSALNVLARRNTEMKAQQDALAADMLPSGDESGDFDLHSINPLGWESVVQSVLENPNHPFAQEFIGWLQSDVMGSLTMNEKAVFQPYLELAISQRLPAFDSEYAKSIGKNPAYFAEVKKKFIDTTYQKIRNNPPDFLSDAENALYLRSLATGRIRAASQQDKALRSKLIRLAHTNPELRAHLLQLLKEAGCEKLPEGGMRDNCEKKKEEGEKADDKADKK